MKTRYPKPGASLLLQLTWGVFFAVLFARMVSVREDGVWFGHVNLWSDWAIHIALANIFATKPPGLWFAYHPVFADGKLTYAFLVNLVSGGLLRLGASLWVAFVIPSIALSCLLIEGMHRLWKTCLGTSRRAALAISLFFLSSGMGFLDYIHDLWNGGALLPAREYSRIESYTWLTGNYVTGHLLPQRAFLLGMTLAVWALYGLFSALLTAEGAPLSPGRKAALFFAGIATGLLPIAHMHSLIAMVCLLAPVFLATWRKRAVWAWFGLPAGLLSISLFWLFIHGGIRSSGFMSFVPGYTAHGLLDWAGLWLRVWGPAVPLAAASLAWMLRRGRPRPVCAFFVGFFVLFAFANLIQTQPMTWDNSKHFLWCYFGFSALAADALAELWHRGRAARAAAATLALTLSLTGAIELVLLQRIEAHSFLFTGREELDLAVKIREETDPLARFLTAPEHNHAIAVWGARPVLLGYPSWAWNFGFDNGPLLRDIPLMYRGGDAALRLLRAYRVSYVFIGPSETQAYRPDEAFFRSHFMVAFSSPRNRVYDTRPLLGPP